MSPVDAVRVSHVSFSYDGTPVLEDVHFTIPQRSFISIVGPTRAARPPC